MKLSLCHWTNPFISIQWFQFATVLVDLALGAQDGNPRTSWSAPPPTYRKKCGKPGQGLPHRRHRMARALSPVYCQRPPRDVGRRRRVAEGQWVKSLLCEVRSHATVVALVRISDMGGSTPRCFPLPLLAT